MIRQKTLAPWHDKIDLLDAAILAFIRELSPHDEEVKRWMHKDMFRLSRKWILAEMPLLHVGQKPITMDWIGRRLKHLQDVGLVKLLTTVNPRTRHFELFGKLSLSYFRAERKANGERSVGVQSHGSMVHTPAEYSPTDHKNDHKREALPPLMAAGGASQLQDQGKTSPRAERTPEEEEAVRLLISNLAWKKTVTRGRQS